MKSPLFAFFGTPEFATYALDALEREGMLPALVVTVPDKPRDRGEVTPTPVKAWAEARGIDVITPENFKETPEELLNTDWDVFVVVAYGKMIPKAVLEMPRKGAVNIHPSLLPKFRGPSPVLSAILADERETGVSVMLLDEGQDTGPVLAQARIEIDEAEWPLPATLLTEMLFTEGGNLLVETLPLWLDGTITPEPQDSARATHTKKFKDEDSLIDPLGDAREQLLKIRAFDNPPAGGHRAHYFDHGRRVIVTDAQISDGTLEILRVIPEGRKETDFKSFLASRANTL
ncbi:MAG: methionyl-tRNA formyltransferase [Patescibacteria group bacterium]